MKKETAQVFYFGHPETSGVLYKELDPEIQKEGILNPYMIPRDDFIYKAPSGNINFDFIQVECG